MATPSCSNCDCKSSNEADFKSLNEAHESKLKRFDSKSIHSGYNPDIWHSKCVVPPIIMSTTHKFDRMGLRNDSGYLYSRCENPTRSVLETCLASLEDAKYALTFASGIGAITPLIYLLKTGDKVLLMNQTYSGTFTFFTKYAPRMGIESTFVDFTDLNEVEKHSNSRVDMVWLESPTNPLLKLINIEAVVKIIRKSHPKAIIVVDNTFASSYAQRPLDLGADISMQSLTKYLNGHSDVLMGGLTFNSDELYKKLKEIQTDIGSIPSPFECYLASRGIKTLSIRMDKHSSNALALAKALEKNPRIEKVIYPGLESYPQHEFFKQNFKCFGGMMAVYIKADMDQTVVLLQSLKIFTFAVSLGGYESLIELPAFMSHHKLSKEERMKMGITDNLVRVSVGLEDPNDLIEDFEQALIKAVPKI